jgi:predicted negative regulator of RcsB-dependent stress response
LAETDEEQIEEIKTWWVENGSSLVIGTVVALTGVFGYRAWENSVSESTEAASQLYESMTSAVVGTQVSSLSSEILASTRALGNQLKIDFPDSTYAHFGALHMAKLAVDSGDLDSAETELRWMLDNDVNDVLEPIVRMRLAQVVAALGRAEQALLLLPADRDVSAHTSSWHEVRGDIHYQLGNMDDARAAYQQAIDVLGEGRTKPVLQAKLEDLTFVEAGKG